MKKIFCILFLFIFVFNIYTYAEDKEIDVAADGAILMDFKTGRVLWEKNSGKPLAMASTTKIMTAVLALENADMEDNVVVSKRAASAPPVKMYLKEGEEITLGNLLYALMLQSSNDSAVAIAEYVGGSVEAFCQMMTDKAKEIGCRDTIFETPNGLDKGNHHSTAYDMALIARYALKNEKFCEIIKTPSVSFKSSKNIYNVVNKDRLLNEYEGALGIKTGFTGKAGHCFVGAAKRGDLLLISVVLASGWGAKGKEQKWKDTKEILNYGFKNYRYYSIIEKNDYAGSTALKKSKEKSIRVNYESDFEAILTEDEYKNIKIEKTIKNEIAAPVKKGQRVGYAEIYSGSEKLADINIVASEEIKRHDFYSSLLKILKCWGNLGIS